MKLLQALYVVILLGSFTFARQNEYEYQVKLSLSTNDGKYKIDLLDEGNFNKTVEGYFFQTEYEKILEGNIIKGGFNFLDPDIFGGVVEMDLIRQSWVKNKFPMSDLEVLTNNLDAGKAFSFFIYPQIQNAEDDSISFFFKYAVFNLVRSTYDHILDYDYSIKLRYKLLTVPFNQTVHLSFSDEFIDSSMLTISWSKNEVQNKIIKPTFEEVIVKEILKSTADSEIKEKLKFSIDFIQDNPIKSEKVTFADFFTRTQQRYLQPVTRIQEGNSVVTLPVSVYQSYFEFPFRLFSKKKSELYKNYKTRERLFQSRYNILIVPITFEKDDLVADLFISYSKLQIDDIPRWTPIRKRIKINKINGVKVDFPKENWSASFIREGESYEIYGLPDFEEYVNEFLIIKVKKGEL